MHKILESRLKAVRDAFMAHYSGGSGLPKASNGKDRELFVDEFLKKVSAPDLRYVGGTIIDSISVERSGQIDVAVILPSAPSFAMPAGEERLMLAESVAAAIEVKSNLSTDWDGVRSTTKQIKALRKHVKDLDDNGRCVVAPIPVYAVGYKGWASVWKLKKKLDETPEDERPDAVLMMESPAFVSRDLWAEADAAIFAFIHHLSRQISAQREIPTDLFRYVGKPVPMPPQNNQESQQAAS